MVYINWINLQKDINKLSFYISRCNIIF